MKHATFWPGLQLWPKLNPERHKYGKWLWFRTEKRVCLALFCGVTFSTLLLFPSLSFIHQPARSVCLKCHQSPLDQLLTRRFFRVLYSICTASSDGEQSYSFSQWEGKICERASVHENRSLFQRTALFPVLMRGMNNKRLRFCQNNEVQTGTVVKLISVSVWKMCNRFQIK